MNPIKRHYEPRKGVISRPRLCTTGTYFLRPEDRRRDKPDFEGGCGFEDPRWHDWSVWQGPEMRPSQVNDLARRRMGFL